MEAIEIAQALDSTTSVVVLTLVLWRLLGQVDKVIVMVDEIINRLIDRHDRERNE